MTSTNERLHLRITPADRDLAVRLAEDEGSARVTKPPRSRSGYPVRSLRALLAQIMQRRDALPPVGPQTLRITPTGLLVTTAQDQMALAWSQPATVTETELHFLVEFHERAGVAGRTLVIPKTPNARATRNFVARLQGHLTPPS